MAISGVCVNCMMFRFFFLPVAGPHQQPVRIKLTDVNDELPEFVNVPNPFLATVSTNAAPGTSVYQLMAQDADEDSHIRYSLESGESWMIES